MSRWLPHLILTIAAHFGLAQNAPALKIPRTNCILYSNLYSNHKDATMAQMQHAHTPLPARAHTLLQHTQQEPHQEP
jgi:hypothetical protein